MNAGRVLATLLLLTLVVAAPPASARGRMGAGDSMSVGDPAFASRLVAVDGKSEFDLAASGGQPVAFVFGSYT